jgi:conjugal transfer pilus assembly protein TraB
MEATLLTGIEADTVDDAQSNPEPIVLRVNAPAVLPNFIKADLEGCFVVANAYGKLNKERVETRLVSLSCLSADGHAIIDEKVKGFVSDMDGKRGLAGIVVSKAGSNVARVMAASMVEGFGAALALDGQTISTSPLGTTQTYDPSRVFKAGAGQGIASGASELAKYWLDLAKQSSPVVEVGAAKKVTVFIQEGVWLNVMENETDSA